MDHIFSVLKALQVHPNSYHLYIDFEKAFNSVVRPTLWCLLEHYNLPDELIQCLRLLYLDSVDAPLVGGEDPFRCAQHRGVCQGSPLSPLLFVLYLNALLFNAPFHPPSMISPTQDTLSLMTCYISAQTNPSVKAS